MYSKSCQEKIIRNGLIKSSFKLLYLKLFTQDFILVLRVICLNFSNSNLQPNLLTLKCCCLEGKYIQVSTVNYP